MKIKYFSVYMYVLWYLLRVTMWFWSRVLLTRTYRAYEMFKTSVSFLKYYGKLNISVFAPSLSSSKTDLSSFLSYAWKWVYINNMIVSIFCMIKERWKNVFFKNFFFWIFFYRNLDIWRNETYTKWFIYQNLW